MTDLPEPYIIEADTYKIESCVHAPTSMYTFLEKKKKKHKKSSEINNQSNMSF